METLKTCPFCGQDIIKIYQSQSTLWIVECQNCTASTGWKESETAAVEAWNVCASSLQETKPPSKTLVEFKKEGGEWRDIIINWLHANCLSCGTLAENEVPSDRFVPKRDLSKRDFEGLAAKIAYSVYKRYCQEEQEQKPLKKEEKWFLDFLGRHGITAQVLHNIKKYRDIATFEQFFEFFDDTGTSLQFAFHFAFNWSSTEEGELFWQEKQLLWKTCYRSSIQKEIDNGRC